jgi:hypothetical protein
LVAACALALVLGSLDLAAGAQTSNHPDLGIPKFYDPPSPLPKGKPGTLLRSEPVEAPKGAQA